MNPSGKIKCAAYIRVSTLNGQDLNNQREPARQVAESRGYEMVAIYEDRSSGAKERRKGLDSLLADARRGRFKVLIVAELSRIARDTRHLLNVLHELTESGITLISLREAIEFNESPFSRGMVTLIGLLVSLERELIRDRIKTALAVRKQTASITGWRCGRPRKINSDLSDAARKLRASGSSLRQIAQGLGISKTTVLRILKEDQNPVNQTNQSS